MKAMLKMELMRAFRNKLMLFSLIVGNGIVIIYYLFSVTKYIKSFYNIVNTNPTMELLSANLCWIGTAFDKYTVLYFFIIPILAAIPYGASLYLDKKDGYMNNILIKTDRKNYYFAKLITYFVSGGVVATMPLVLSYILAIISLPSIRPTVESRMYNVFSKNIFSSIFYSDYTFVYVIIFIVFDFILFGLINCLCMFFTYWEENRFAIVLTPFVLCYGLHMIGQYFVGTDKTPLTYAKLNYITSDNLIYILCQIFIFVILAFSSLRKGKKDVL